MGYSQVNIFPLLWNFFNKNWNFQKKNLKNILLKLYKKKKFVSQSKSGKTQSNGYSNGTITSKKHDGDTTLTNGHCNGVSKTETTQQKHQNGSANGAVNVSDYYVKSEDITTNMSLTQRKVTAEQ